MVCHSLRHEGEELLTQRDGVEGYARSGRTMGVPLLHPWANRLAEWDYEALGRRVDLEPLRGRVVKADGETGLPMHGVLPAAWEVVEATSTRLAAERTPADDEGFRAAFPFPHRIRLEAELSPGELRIATTIEALEGEVPVAFGFHPYLTLPGVARADYEVELPPMRRLALDASKVPTGVDRGRPGARGRARRPRPRRRLRLRPGRRGVRRRGRRAPRGRALRARLPVRAGVRPARQGPDLLRADDRAHERAAHRGVRASPRRGGPTRPRSRSRWTAK